MGNLLDNLNDSKEIQAFSNQQLTDLADDCREKIIDVISRRGGHLASSLGVVELTVALAKVFDFENDKVIWDVGHQAHAYKILTDRRDRFEKIGEKDGISKFLSRSESKYDHFGAGHASTSISAALGCSIAGRLNRENYKSIAIIGDGSMTGGLAFEALNHAGHLDENLIVIFNDNEMGIDPIVGALSKTIINISSSKSFNKLRNELSTQSNEKVVPLAIRKTLKKINESFMAFFTQGIWFEKLNFRYFGQVDGHNLKDLVSLFKVTKGLKGPILLHVATQKGKGYTPAEQNALNYHGVSAFDPKSGRQVHKSESGKSMTSIWSQRFTKIMEADDKVVGISAAMLANTGLASLLEKYPKRIFDVGIAESHAVTFAGGLASQGIKPFVVIYSTFLQRAFDNIIHDIALQNLPVRFILDRSGFVGPDGATHHGSFDLSYLRMIPNMAIMAPRNGKELQAMINLAYEYDRGPIAIRFPKGNSADFYKENLERIPPIPFGEGELIQSGKDILMIAVGSMVDTAIQVAMRFERKGISVGVINARFVKPLHKKLILQEVAKVEILATLEESTKVGGFGSGVMELLHEEGIFKPIVQFGIPDQFFEHAKVEEQLQDAGLDANSIEERLESLLKQSCS